MTNDKLSYVLHLADNVLILGQRLGEWCGHGPVLEQDIAITNIALDLIGQARSYYQYAAELEGRGRTEDDLAYLRGEMEFRNALLLETENRDWAYTIVRQFLWDTYHYELLNQLRESSDEQLRAIALKSIKEVTYHRRYSSEWMIRLGDGTELSHQKMQTALNDLWIYAGELTEPAPYEIAGAAAGYGVDPGNLKTAYETRVDEILAAATLRKPEGDWHQTGGKVGRHTERLGYLLAEMQSLKRAHPDASW